MYRREGDARQYSKRSGEHHGGGYGGGQGGVSGHGPPRFDDGEHRNKRRMEDRDWDGRRGPYQSGDDGYWDGGRRGPHPVPRQGYIEGMRREAAPPSRPGSIHIGAKQPGEAEIREERRIREKLIKSSDKQASSGTTREAKDKETQDAAAAGKKKLPYCHKCTKTGHIQRECTAPPTCYTCKKPGHVATECLDGRVTPKLRICGGGAGDKMFYSLRLDIEDDVCAPTTVTGVLRVLEGVCDGDLVLLELTHLFEQDWPWRIKPLGPGDYLIEFPDRASRREVTKFTNGFNFVCDNSVKAKVSDSIREFDAFGMLDEAWARVYGLPDWARKEEAVWELSYMAGEPRDVDVDSLPGVRPVRVKIACKDKTQVDGFYNVYINGRGFRLEWEVEKNNASSSFGSPSPKNKKRDNEDNNKGDTKKKGPQSKDNFPKQDGPEKDGEAGQGSSASRFSDNKRRAHDAPRDSMEDVEDAEYVEKKTDVKNSPVKLLAFYNEKVDIPETMESEEDASSPIDATPVAMAFPPGKPQWDGKTEWSLVSHHHKKKETLAAKTKEPAQAQRQSDRLMGKSDGLPIQKRAEIRASKKNDISVDPIVASKA